jgi:hypothetical protein
MTPLHAFRIHYVHGRLTQAVPMRLLCQEI